MDLDERIQAAEKNILTLAASQGKHEATCALRYEAIKLSVDQLGGYVKWLAIAVGALALVSVGVASVDDILRSGAARMGVIVKSPPD